MMCVHSIRGRALISAFVFFLLFANEPVAEGSSDKNTPSSGRFENALRSGEFSENLKLFYMDRAFDHKKPNARALNLGGILKYESGDFFGLKFGLAYFGSHRIGTFYSREEGIDTNLLQQNGEDIHFIGEAYMQYGIKKTVLKTGRQRLSTPLLEDNDQRVVPTTYDATILRSEDMPNTTIEVGHVNAYSGFASKYSGFDDQNGAWGKDGLGYIYMENSSIKHLKLRYQYIKALSDTNNSGAKIERKDYQFFNLKYSIPLGTQSYIKAQYLGNTYIDAPNSKVIGAKIGTTLVDMLDIALVYDQIIGNNLETIGSAPMYTDFQQGYGAYEPSTGFGGLITIRPFKNFSLKLGYANVGTNRSDYIDDFAEYIVDLKYKFNEWSKFRIRYSFKDQSDKSERLSTKGIGGREDRTDIRVIYYISL